MNKLYLTLTFLLFAVCCFAQDGIYFKAVYLKKLYNQTTQKIKIDPNAVAALHGIYDDADPATLVGHLNANPFISGSNFQFAASAAGGSGPFNFSSVGGIDVTNIANGISAFLVERAKQELTIAFFDRFKKFSEANPEYQTLFPKTCAALEKILNLSYPQMLPSLRSAFLEDLKTVTDRIDDVVNLPKYQKLLANLPEVSISLKSIKLVHELETGYSNPADVIKSFAAFPEWTAATASVTLKNTGSTLAILSLFSESIRNDPSTNTAGAWVPVTMLRQLLNDDMLFRIYAALLYQKTIHDPINFYDARNQAQPFATIFQAQAKNLTLLQGTLKDFFVLTGPVSAAAKTITDKQSGHTAVTNDDYYNYINTAIDLVDNSFKIVDSFTGKNVPDNYFTLIRKSNDVYKDVYTKNYPQLFGDAIDIFDIILKQADISAKYSTLKTNTTITTYAGTEKKTLLKMADMDNSYKTLDETSVSTVISDVAYSSPEVVEATAHYRLSQLAHFFEELKPYGLFMADIVTATKSEDVTAALQNAVLPAGSSSVKKNTAGNLSVQAYLGVYLSNSNNSFSSWTSKFGVIAPIGISYTPGFLSWKKGGSVSIFGSLFDLGAIVDYDLKKDSTVTASGTTNKNAVSKDYKVKLGQIFSPGVFLVYGLFGNLPISIGGGGQYGPGLSKIDTKTNVTVLNNPVWRWSVFLSVDIPLFTLTNKNKSK